MSAAKIDSITRALAHHERTGTIHSYSPPIPGGRRTWRVSLTVVDSYQWSTGEVMAFCHGVATGLAHREATS